MKNARILTMGLLLSGASIVLAPTLAESQAEGARESRADESRKETKAESRGGAESNNESRTERSEDAPRTGDKNGGARDDGGERADSAARPEKKDEQRDEEAGKNGRAPARPASEEGAAREGEEGAPDETIPSDETSSSSEEAPSSDAAPIGEVEEKDPSELEEPNDGLREPPPLLSELIHGDIPDDARTISLSDAIALALSHHPRLGAADSEVRAAEARLRKSRSSYYPKVDVWVQALRASMNPSQAVYHTVPGMPRLGGSAPAGVEATGSYNQFLAAATVHQLLYDFGRTQGDVGAQKAMVEAARMNHELISQRVIFDVTRAFYEVLRRRSELLVAQEGVRRSLRIYELARSGVEAGLRPPSESARAEADAARAELEEIQARAELDIARVQFTNTLGGAPPDGPFEPAGGLDFDLPPIDEEEAVEAALSDRPELRAFAFRETELRERIRSARGAHFPRLEALFGMSSRGMFLNGEDSLNHAANNWNVGVVMHVPIFQGMRVSAQVDELKAEILSLEANREVIHQAVLLEVKRTLAQVRSTKEAVRAAEKGLRAARVALDTTEGRYRSGLANIVEMTDAQSAYIGAVSAALSASYEQILAFARLRLAMGQLGSERATPTPPPAD